MQSGQPGYQGVSHQGQPHGPGQGTSQQQPRQPSPPAQRNRRRWIVALLIGSFVVAAALLGLWGNDQMTKKLDEGMRDLKRIEPIARSFVERSERGAWEQVDAMMCTPPAARSQLLKLGPLDVARTNMDDDAACVVYKTTVGGSPRALEVRLRRRGEGWCVDPSVKITCRTPG